MSLTARTRRPSVVVSLALALLVALVVAPRASAHPGPHNAEEAPGIGVLLHPGTSDETFLPGFQYAGTPPVDGTEAPLAYAGNGCSPASYAGRDVAGKIALADRGDTSTPCPPSTFFQFVAYAEQAGAIGLVIVPRDGAEPTTNGTAVQGGIPAMEVFRTAEILAAKDATVGGTEVIAALADTRTPIPSSGPAPCENGVAKGDDGTDADGEFLAGGEFECNGIDLLSFVAEEEFNSAGVSDIWGWTDTEGDGGEYVIMGKTNGVAFFDVTDAENPVVLGELPNPSPAPQTWHDIKVYKNHAFIVSESETHGMTVFDLTKLRELGPSEELRQFSPDATYELTSAAHNLEINTETGFAYIVGGNAGLVAPDHCMSGLHMVNIQDPTNPTFAGCFLQEGGPGTAARTVGEPVVMDNSPAAYVHDTTCVIYQGPDTEHQGKEICFNAAEDGIVIADVTNKVAPTLLGSTSYQYIAYAHQGSLTADQKYLLVNDELDEQTFEEVETTRTMVLDVSDLDNPQVHFIHDHETTSIDHNNYVHDGFVYQSNYAAGLRVLDVSEVADRRLNEVAFFDTYPAHTDPTFDGTWSNYPFFESGTVAVSGREEGLFLVKVQDDVLNPPQPDVEIACTDCPVEAGPSAAGTATIAVSNTGNVDDVYEITFDGLPDAEGYSATASPDPVAVQAGETGTVTVTVALPRQSPDGTYRFTVTATSVGYPDVSASELIEVHYSKANAASARR